MSGISTPYYKARELKPYREAEEILGKFFQIEGMPTEYADLCRTFPGGYVFDFAQTLYCLRRKWPQREPESFSFEEVQGYAACYKCAQALTDTALNVTEFFSECLVPHDPSSGWTENADMFRPEKMNIPAAKEKKVQAPAAPAVRRVPVNDQEQERDLRTVIEEVEELRKRLRQKDEELKHLHHQLEVEKKEILAAQAESVKAAEDREELISLREHVYHSTEQDAPAAEKSLEEMEQEIARKRVVIIGGHSNWTYKLRNRFRNWVFLDPKASGSIDGNLLNKADRVFFFTEIISHSTYYRFIKLVRERGMPFGYIHSINVESNIRQIYEELETGK